MLMQSNIEGKNKSMADSHKSVKKHRFRAFTAVSGRSSADEGWTDTNAYWKILWILWLLGKESSWIDFFAVSFVVDIESRRDARLLFAYHNGTHFYQTEGCCLLYLNSNYVNSLKSFFVKKSYIYKYNRYKKTHKEGQHLIR